MLNPNPTPPASKPISLQAGFKSDPTGLGQDGTPCKIVIVTRIDNKILNNTAFSSYIYIKEPPLSFFFIFGGVHLFLNTTFHV